MEYIDKSKSREWAHSIIKAFLKRRLDESGKYPEDLYAAFRADPECKNAFVERLLEDNSHRCCYCMRDIKGTTLEHVIPNSTKSPDKYGEYFQLESELDKGNIILAKDFLERPGDVPPFPHTVAYENLIPSCFGYLPSGQSKCCNNYRGDKFVHPLVFRKNISKEVTYKTDGNITWSEDPEPVVPTLTKLGLDCTELKAIRRIWFYLASNGLSCEDSNRETTIEVLLNELGVPSNMKEREMQNMLLNFKKPEYWKLLERYTYFNDVGKYD